MLTHNTQKPENNLRNKYLNLRKLCELKPELWKEKGLSLRKLNKKPNKLSGPKQNERQYQQRKISRKELRTQDKA
jgi:hypothetical protein